MIGITKFNCAIGGVKKHTKITGHNRRFESPSTQTPDLAWSFSGGEYRCSYLSIESQICNSLGNKKGSTANATSSNNNFINHCANDNKYNNTDLLFQKYLYLDAKRNETFAASFEFLSCCTSITPVFKPLAKRDKTAKIIIPPTTVRRFIFSIINTYTLIQPLGSIPRDCNSLRSILFIHVAREVSPSFFISSSNCLRKSDGSLIWYWSVFFISLDIVITILLLFAYCNYNVIAFELQQKNKTPQCSSTNGVSNHNVMEPYDMAMYKSTQTHPKFKWRFFSCQQSRYFTVEACSEQEARSLLPDAPCLFSARIRQGVIHA